MKKRKANYRLLFSILLLTLGSFMVRAQETEYKVIPDKSEVKWKAYKVGGFHEGLVNVKDGQFQTSAKQINSGTFTVDMPTIIITDTESPKLLKHLHSPDFFDTGNHPESKLVIENTQKLEGDEYQANGKITIRGITKPISFKIILIAETENFISYKAKMEIDRTQFGIVYRSSAVGDTFIMDNFDLEVKITAKKS